MELDQRGFRTEIDKLRNELGMAHSAHTPTRSDIADEEWDRKPDLTLVRFNTAELVAKEAILDTVREWIGDMGVGEEWERGPERGLSERYTLVFTGLPRIAGRRAQQSLQLLRQPGGEWRKLYVKSPAGRNIELLASGDKSRKQIKTETTAKRLARVLLEAHPNLDYHVLRREGVVTVGWRRLARIVVRPGDEPTSLEWNQQVLAETSVNKDRINEIFAERAGGGDRVT